MPFTPPNLTQMDHSKWLRANLTLSPEFDNYLSTIAENIHRNDTKPVRRDTFRNTRAVLSVVFGNLYRLHMIDPNLLCIISHRNGFYKKDEFNPLGLQHRSLRRTLEYLIGGGGDPELGAGRPYVERFAGNHVREGNGGGITSRYRATARLIDEMEAFWGTRALAGRPPRLTGNVSYFQSPNFVQVADAFEERSIPIIRLKDENKRLIATPQTPETIAMTERLGAYNGFLCDHWIDLLVPDAQFRNLATEPATNAAGGDDEFGDSQDRGRGGCDLLFERRLYRVFNNNDIMQGGRFYGGWWQRIRSEYRHFITINWYPTAEVDYSNMQAAMLYAHEELDLPDDAYSLEGIDARYRNLIKRTFFKLINATDRIRAPRLTELPEGWTFGQILEALQRKHSRISRHFRTGIGIRLQRIDSDVAEGVMLRMMEKGRLVLPVHDSFIVQDGQRDLLTNVMREEYAKCMHHQIGVDRPQTWTDINIPPEVIELHNEGIGDADDIIGELEDRPEYAGYRQRKIDFMEQMNEEWGHRHNWYNG